MVKTLNSQQVERGQTKGILQWVERDASSLSPDSTVSFSVSFIVTQYEHYVQEEKDIDNVIEDPEPEGQVQDSIATHKLKRNVRKLARFSDMMVAYALSVEIIEDSVPSSFRKVELSSEFELWRKAMVEEIESLHVNDTWELAELPKRKKPLNANKFLRRRMNLHMVLYVTRPSQ